MKSQRSTEELLAEVGLFRDLTGRQRRHIAGLMTRLDEPAGTVLTREGAPGAEFVIVLDGSVEVRHGDRVVKTLGPGDYVGEIALLRNQPRTATVVARTPVAIEVLNRREFTTLLADNPELATQLLATMAERLAELDSSTL
ncbi:MAG: cyclic nucleotide-binding domain-containing protein [Actinobacteria bacterium]|nr:cyclic nucleotide-binding domain-containing protein [Actinomycetota bacterium]